MPRVLVDPVTNKPSTQPDELVPQLVEQGWTEYAPERAASDQAAAVIDEQYSGIDDKIQAGIIGGLQGVTLGGLGVAKRLIDPEGAKEWGRKLEHNPEVAIPAEIIGGVAGAVGTGGVGAAARAGKEAGLAARVLAKTPAGKIASIGGRIAEAGEGAGAAAKIARAAAGSAVEGTLAVAGSKAGDLALSDDPLAVERIGSDLHSAFLYGGVGSGVIGGLGKSIELGLGAARRGLARQQARAAAAASIPADLVGLDKKALRAAEEAELGAIEAARVPQRQQFADDVNKFREISKRDQPWVAVSSGSKAAKKAAKEAAKAAALEVEEKVVERTAAAAAEGATKDTRLLGRAAAQGDDDLLEAAVKANVPPAGVKYPRWVRETEKVYLEADRALDRVLRNPKRLASDPHVVRAALQQQEHALELISQRADELRALHLADRSGRRALALEKVGPTLEANRQLQARLAEISAKPASERLAGIRDAVDLLSGPQPPKSLLAKIGGGAAYAAIGAGVYGAGDALGLPGAAAVVAPFLGAAGADFVANRLAGRIAGGLSEAAARTGRAVDAFANVTQKANRVAPVLASRVLAEVRFAPEPPPVRGRRRQEEEVATARAPATLEKSFEARAAEIGQSTMPTPDGPKVRPAARRAIAERLRPIAVRAPILADRLETLAVKRLEFLAERMPKFTQLGMTRIPPNEMAMRAWARYIAAADGPAAIEERLADGTITPEDAETMRELYPERMAEIVKQIVGRITELRGKLPSQRRIALSIFTGAPVDATMEPHIIDVLQSGFASEPGTEGGTQAPQPQPAFASVQKVTPTPAQERAGM